MTQQIAPIQQVGSPLQSGKRYYHGLPTNYERVGYYIYDGVIEGKHQFIAEGVFENTIRKMLVRLEDLEVKEDGRAARIRFNSYMENTVLKNEQPEEYQRLENLFGGLK